MFSNGTSEVEEVKNNNNSSDTKVSYIDNNINNQRSSSNSTIYNNNHVEDVVDKNVNVYNNNTHTTNEEVKEYNINEVQDDTPSSSSTEDTPSSTLSKEIYDEYDQSNNLTNTIKTPSPSSVATMRTTFSPNIKSPTTVTPRPPMFDYPVSFQPTPTSSIILYPTLSPNNMKSPTIGTPRPPIFFVPLISFQPTPTSIISNPTTTFQPTTSGGRLNTTLYPTGYKKTDYPTRTVTDSPIKEILFDDFIPTVLDDTLFDDAIDNNDDKTTDSPTSRPRPQTSPVINVIDDDVLFPSPISDENNNNNNNSPIRSSPIPQSIPPTKYEKQQPTPPLVDDNDKDKNRNPSPSISSIISTSNPSRSGTNNKIIVPTPIKTTTTYIPTSDNTMILVSDYPSDIPTTPVTSTGSINT